MVEKKMVLPSTVFHKPYSTLHMRYKFDKGVKIKYAQFTEGCFFIAISYDFLMQDIVKCLKIYSDVQKVKKIHVLTKFCFRLKIYFSKHQYLKLKLIPKLFFDIYRLIFNLQCRIYSRIKRLLK